MVKSYYRERIQMKISQGKKHIWQRKESNKNGVPIALFSQSQDSLLSCHCLTVFTVSPTREVHQGPAFKVFELSHIVKLIDCSHGWFPPPGCWVHVTQSLQPKSLIIPILQLWPKKLSNRYESTSKCHNCPTKKISIGFL